MFWKLKPADRAKLMQFQYKIYGTKLDIASQKPPWEIEPPPPVIPVRTSMTEEELGKFIAQPPEHQGKVE